MIPNVTAHEVLSQALKVHISGARSAAQRVVSTVTLRRLAASVNGGEASADDSSPAEAVHDFRVSLRRLRTALKPARAIYGKKKMRSLGEDLKRFADVTSALRDEEVLRETLTSLTLSTSARAAVTSWITRRARQERARRTAVVRVLREDSLLSNETPAGPTLEDCLTRLEKRLNNPKKSTSAVELGQRSIAKARSEIPDTAALDTSDVAAMHALRIRFKRLRYTAELFKSTLGEGAARTAAEASRLQSCLGHLHDFDEAIVRMTRAWGLASAPRAAVLKALAEGRARMAERCKKELAAAQITLASALNEPC